MPRALRATPLRAVPENPMAARLASFAAMPDGKDAGALFKTGSPHPDPSGGGSSLRGSVSAAAMTAASHGPAGAEGFRWTASGAAGTR